MTSPQAATAPDAAAAQYLTFLLGREVFAMDIRTVREIIQYGMMTAVPLMPNFVRGVIQPARRGGAGDRSAGALRPRPGRHRQEDLHRDLRFDAAR